MKRLIFLLFPIVCHGQIFLKDTALYSKDTVPSIFTTATTSGTILWNTRWDTVPVIRKYDTVKVIMQVSDTTYISNFESRMMFSDSVDYIIPHYLAMVWWMHGYLVRELHTDTYYDPNTLWVDPNGNLVRDRVREYWVNVGYLDPEKKPILKSMIVWQIK